MTREIPRRFGKRAPEHRGRDDWNAAARAEQRPPTQSRQHAFGENGGKHAADRNAHDRQRHRKRTMPPRHEFRRERRRIRKRPAQSKTRNQPERAESEQRRRDRGRDREEAEDGHAAEKRGLAPQPIAGKAGQRAAEHHAHHAGCEHGRKRAARHTPFAHDCRHGDPQQLVVDAVEDDRERDQKDDEPLVARPLPIVEQDADVDIAIRQSSLTITAGIPIDNVVTAMERWANPMAQFCSLEEAIADAIRDGDVVAMEGFTHLIPFAAGHEVIRQGRRGLTLVRMTPDLIYDQMIGAGCVARLVFSWGGNPGVGSLHRLRDAVEHAWPAPLEVEEYSHAALANAYEAGAANLPFAAFRGQPGGLGDVNPKIRSVTCPFTNETLTAVPAVRPDVTVIHAQKADRDGNVLIEGIVGVQKEAALAARRAVVVTVEEQVDSLRDAHPNACILPRWVVSAIAIVPGGAWPSYAHGYYARDNAFYTMWDEISRDRDRFAAWMAEQVMSQGPAAFGRRIGRLMWS